MFAVGWFVSKLHFMKYAGATRVDSCVDKEQSNRIPFFFQLVRKFPKCFCNCDVGYFVYFIQRFSLLLVLSSLYDFYADNNETFTSLLICWPDYHNID